MEELNFDIKSDTEAQITLNYVLCNMGREAVIFPNNSRREKNQEYSRDSSRDLNLCWSRQGAVCFWIHLLSGRVTTVKTCNAELYFIAEWHLFLYCMQRLRLRCFSSPLRWLEFCWEFHFLVCNRPGKLGECLLHVSTHFTHSLFFKMELPPRPELFDFHGVSMIDIFTNNWEKIQNFQARPDDIVIATYPKAGWSKQTVM